MVMEFEKYIGVGRFSLESEEWNITQEGIHQKAMLLLHCWKIFYIIDKAKGGFEPTPALRVKREIFHEKVS